MTNQLLLWSLEGNDKSVTVVDFGGTVTSQLLLWILV